MKLLQTYFTEMRSQQQKLLGKVYISLYKDHIGRLFSSQIMFNDAIINKRSISLVVDSRFAQRVVKWETCQTHYVDVLGILRETVVQD